jgi:enoyl-CoA hydratase/carnithine racemase
MRRRSAVADFKNITYETKARLAYVRINRPERRNAIDPDTSRELRDAFEGFKADDDAWVAILTGIGDQAFSAGADLVAMAQAFAQTGTRPGAGGDGRPGWDVPFGGVTRGFECWKPLIAAINGYCLAGGLELALACDIRIAADHATFGLPEPKRAIIPAAGGTQRLPRSVPLAFAMELLMTGDRFDAETALRFGLVSRVVPADKLMATAEEVAGRILECGPLAVRYIKEAALRGREMSLEDGLKLESQMAGKVFQSEDAREGPTAFAQKRKPEYKGR